MQTIPQTRVLGQQTASGRIVDAALHALLGLLHALQRFLRHYIGRRDHVERRLPPRRAAREEGAGDVAQGARDVHFLEDGPYGIREEFVT